MSGVLVLQRHDLVQVRSAVEALDEAGVRCATLTHAFAMAGHDPAVFRDLCVRDLNDTEGVHRVVDWLVRTRGLTHVLALHEKMIGVAAEVRERWDLSGMRPATAVGFRDKVVMKERVAAAGVAVPRFRAVDSAADLDTLDWATSRYVLKPRSGLGSERTYAVSSAREARGLWAAAAQDGERFEVEEFVDGPVHHVDSIVDRGRVTFSSVGEYVSAPLCFTRFGSSASVTVTDADLVHRLSVMAQETVTALGLESGVTHLEAFRRTDGTLVFCEVAARPAGGGLADVVARAHGVDLVRAAAFAECGLAVPVPPTSDVPDGATWGSVGIFPTPERRPPPSRTVLDGLGVVDHVHHEDIGGRHPRHAADFEHTLVVRARDAETFHERFDALQTAFGIDGDLRVASGSPT